MHDPGEVCICGHHRNMHDGNGDCWAIARTNAGADVHCLCLSYEEREREREGGQG